MNQTTITPDMVTPEDIALIVSILRLDDEVASRIKAGLSYTEEVAEVVRHRLTTRRSMSACNTCGKQYPTAPLGYMHKCGECSGICYPVSAHPAAGKTEVVNWDEVGHTADAVRDAARIVSGKVGSYDASPKSAEMIVAHVAQYRPATEAQQATGKTEAVERIADALAADNDSEVLFMKGDNKGGWRRLAKTARSTLATPQPTETQTLDDLRAKGWMVAVHNDYRLNGKPYTFWLFTHPSGRWIKGEGETDAQAIADASSQIAQPTETQRIVARSSVRDGKEQDAFEIWAAGERYEMQTHPLHWLFLNERTAAARQGWKAGLQYAVSQMERGEHLTGEGE